MQKGIYVLRQQDAFMAATCKSTNACAMSSRANSKFGSGGAETD